jgi:hypothetical protein
MGMQMFCRLLKVDPIKGIVTGVAACEEPDKTGEIFDYASSKPHFMQWSAGIAKATNGKSVGNVRSMHTKVAAGKLTDISFDDAAKSIEVTAKIVDAAELNKLSEGVYSGFSIGGDYEKKWKDGELVRYTAKPNEISIVDNPCMPSATFSVVKEDGSTELRKFTAPVAAAPAKTGPVQKWVAADGTTFDKKSDAEAHDAKASDPAAKLNAAVASVSAQVKKAESLYDGYEASEEASEETIELKDIADLPEIVRAAMANNDTAEVFRVAYNKARANGLGPVEAIDDAWGVIVSNAKKTIDGKYEITGELNSFTESPDQPKYGEQQKAAGSSTAASEAVKNGLEQLLARNAPRAADATSVAKREFSQAERDKAADAGEAMNDGSYPIKNTKDLQNAIQSFGRAKNKASVKAHIKTRAKALGAESQLPDSWKDGADKALISGDLRKGLYAVCRLAQLIEDLEWFQQSQELEAATEGDGSDNPVKAKQVVAAACALLRSIVEEETNELLSDQEQIDFGEMLEMAAHTRGSKALAKTFSGKAPPKLVVEMRKAHSKAEAGHVMAAHDHLAQAGANCPNPPDEAAGNADGDEAESDAEAEKVAKAGKRHNAADQAHIDSAHDHLDKMGYCGGTAEKLAKAMTAEDKVHLESAHDHVSKCGIGCGMSKSGARHSAADMERLTKAHDHLAEAGATCPTHSAGVMDSIGKPAADAAADAASEKTVGTGALVKALADKNAVIDRLEKAANAAEVAVRQLGERIARIEKQEVTDPARRTYRVVSKTEDDIRAAEAVLEKARRENPRDLAMALLQDSQNNPLDITQFGRR